MKSQALKTQAVKAQPLDSKDALLAAALTVFAQKGFEGTTVKDLADEAGVNVSLVSYHFGGKEGLYKTCIENFGTQHVQASERILRPAQSREDLRIRLKLFAEEVIETFHHHADACKIVIRGMDTLDPITLQSFKSVFTQTFEALHDFMKHGQRLGFVRADVDTEIVTNLMFGSLIHLNRSREVAKYLKRRNLNETAYQTDAIEHWVLVHTEGVLVHKPHDRDSK